MPKTELARHLRRNFTPAETRFWNLLHPFRQSGWHFRRQAPIGPYIADFACKRSRLIVEIDGDSHYTDFGIARDTVRSAYLASRGYRIVRFTNDDVLANPDGVHDALVAVLAELKNTPS